MSAKLIDGKAVSAQIVDELSAEVSKLSSKPHIAFIRVGEDPASVSYVRNKELSAEKIGMTSTLKVFPESITQEKLFEEIDTLNDDPQIHGILVQSPLPSHLDERSTFNRVYPQKDVDGLSSANLGRLVQEDPDGFAPCTPSGIVELLNRYEISTQGKNVVVVGRSLLVGKSSALLFLRKASDGNATVTVCHSRTRDLTGMTLQADILISAIGKPCLVTEDMVKPGTVVVDVGINRVDDSSRPRGYRLVGDVDFDAVRAKASYITPVPGGVGPMTVAMLMKNTLKAYRLAQ